MAGTLARICEHSSVQWLVLRILVSIYSISLLPVGPFRPAASERNQTKSRNARMLKSWREQLASGKIKENRQSFYRGKIFHGNFKT